MLLLTVTVGCGAVPARKTLCVKVELGTPLRLSLKRRVALLAPPCFGMNMTDTVQLPWATTVLLQIVLAIEKSLAFDPDIQMPVTLTGVGPGLARVTS